MKKNLLTFTQNLSNLLNSGMNVRQSLVLCSQISSENKNFCTKILQNLDEGKTLAESFLLSEANLSNFYMNFIELGQESGKIGIVFQKLSEYLVQSKKNREKILQSLFYPILVLVTTFAILLFALFYVYPKFSIVLNEFSLANSNFFESGVKAKRSLISFCIFFVAIFLLIFVAKFYSAKNENFKLLLDFAKLKIPFLKNFILCKNLKDLSFSLSLLCQNGIVFVQAFDLAKNSVSNLFLKNEINGFIQELKKGLSVEDALKVTKVFPKYFCEMLKLAQKTGKTRECFSQMENFYVFETDKTVNFLSTSAESFFILISGLFVLFFVLKFVLPIFSTLGECI